MISMDVRVEVREMIFGITKAFVASLDNMLKESLRGRAVQKIRRWPIHMGLTDRTMNSCSYLGHNAYRPFFRAVAVFIARGRQCLWHR